MSLSRRATVGLVYMCVVFLLAISALGVIGVHGARAGDATSHAIAEDELNTAAITSQVGRTLDRVALTADALLAAAPGQRAALASALYNHDIPAVETELAALSASHADDGSTEQRLLAGFFGQWHRLRSLLNTLPARLVAISRAESELASAELVSAFEPLSTGIERLIAREQRDAHARNSHASRSADATVTTILVTILASLLVGAVVAAFAVRRIFNSLEPAQQQVVFADTMQLAEDEDEAHGLLQRHLERTIAGTTTTVLNRNNSADRLEAKTPLPVKSPLIATLRHATPRACLAVRSGRVNQNDGGTALLACSVCSSCPGATLCSPLTVGGEVIGAVLVNRASALSVVDERRVRDSVAQAAPVLANLRNLAIAETRAATDSLTGLPNKRASGDTMKQLLAQSARTFTPLSVLVLDLDHFKDINDRLGHPVGDTVLAGVGAALRSVMRDSDFAGRTGGEEFLVLLPDTAVEGAVEAAERIRTAISAVQIPGDTRVMSASIGVATYPDHATSAERLERLADAALYLAKRSGRGRTEVATPAGEGISAEEVAGGIAGDVTGDVTVPSILTA